MLDAGANGASCTSALITQTLQIRAICITSNDVSDAAVVPQLLAQPPAGEPLLTLAGDGAYDTKEVHAAVMEQNVTPIISQERMPGCAKAMFLRTVMRLSPHAGEWGARSGNAGAATTDAVRWRPG
ncbi:hypothetical protein AB6N01_02135 [Alcaligenes nematophilus]|uniref:hypothetical protein n=1 Tax=Alcaligenes nematophilus TaxID=2994643 RepID=UPI0034E0BBB2